MRTIKYYSNRKLYDTSESRYTNLSELVNRIKRGETIQVISNSSNEDVTNHTMREALGKLEVPTNQYIDLIKEHSFAGGLE